MLNDVLAREVAQALGDRYERAARVGGGCISPAWRVELKRAGPIFLKLPPAMAGGEALLVAEAFSLRQLAAAGALRVPQVLAVEGGGRWLALEWLEPGRAAPLAWSALGEGLAMLHRQSSSRFGWPQDNYIGSLPQRNGYLESWPAFWWERRLAPQLQLADERRLPGIEAQRFEELRERLPVLLAAGAVEGASLLHGDLWNGNVHFTSDGMPALIDSSAYYGHREVDLAMAALFGGFDRDFYRAYDAAWPLQREGLEQRRAVYQLYYLLVHVNLFGGGYVPQTLAVLERALGQGS